MSAPPACYRHADLVERQFGDLARRYAGALNETDESEAPRWPHSTRSASRAWTRSRRP